LRRVQFGGEAMSMKHLNRWRAAYPNVVFANLYGPTEVTDTCTYYIFDRPFHDTDPMPIGHPCKNKDVFLLNEKNQLVADNEIGEICVRGTGVAYGYYNMPEKTRDSFVQNPLQNAYAEIIYRTGDLARYNDHGELVYISRKDFQIKHMGHRIELGEIETAASSVTGVGIAACCYDYQHSKIVLFYTGETDKKEIISMLKTHLPEYMIPGRYIHMESMPMNLNGKVDRQKLQNYLADK